MSEIVFAQYVFLDIVGYSKKERTVEAQTDIIKVLDEIVGTAVESLEIDDKECIFLPTGDGICIVILAQNYSYDIQIRLALKILKLLKEYNDSQEDEIRRFQVRIGISENSDNIIKDINGQRNIAGKGITHARRIMDVADEGNIMVTPSVHNRLSQRTKYHSRFGKYTFPIKHNEWIDAYHFSDPSIEYLNSEYPTQLDPRRVASESEAQVRAENEHLRERIRELEDEERGLRETLDGLEKKRRSEDIRKGLRSIYVSLQTLLNRQISEDSLDAYAQEVDAKITEHSGWIERHIGEVARVKFLDRVGMMATSNSRAINNRHNAIICNLTRFIQNLEKLVESDKWDD